MMDPRPRMTEEEEERLLDELLDVLDEVTRTSGCADMAPLWLLATRRPRAEHFRSSSSEPLHVPPHIRAWGKTMRSKYVALAAWRHAVLAERILDALDPRGAAAVRAMYFTPTESNEPPYSWSKASSRHPQACEWPSANALDVLASRGCRDAVALLRARIDDALIGASCVVEARAAIMETGARDGTLRDVLRYDHLRGGRP